MRKQILKSSLMLLLVGTLAVSSGGCSKKEVTPPDGGAAGKNIDYPAANGYSENNLAGEGTLDDSKAAGNLSVNAQGEQSDEYKRKFGRSSSQFLPIYFEFDQSSIRADMKDNMVHNGDYLRANPTASIVIEGNCDDKGTNEYNLALGERRAITAKEYLINLGIEGSRIRTVSYGEERPLFQGEDEMNRRDDFIQE